MRKILSLLSLCFLSACPSGGQTAFHTETFTGSVQTSMGQPLRWGAYVFGIHGDYTLEITYARTLPEESYSQQSITLRSGRDWMRIKLPEDFKPADELEITVENSDGKMHIVLTDSVTQTQGCTEFHTKDIVVSFGKQGEFRGAKSYEVQKANCS